MEGRSDEVRGVGPTAGGARVAAARASDILDMTAAAATPALAAWATAMAAAAMAMAAAARGAATPQLQAATAVRAAMAQG